MSNKLGEWEIEFDHQFWDNNHAEMFDYDNIKDFIRNLISQTQTSTREAYQQELVEKIDGWKRGLELSEAKVMEHDERDRQNYENNPDSMELLQKVKLNEGTTAHYYGGILRGKIEVLTDILRVLPIKEIDEMEGER